MLTTADEIDSIVIAVPPVTESLARTGDQTRPLPPARAGDLTHSSDQGRAQDQVAVLADGVFFSLMVGTGETYLPAFALALGASQLLEGLEITTGLLAAIPIFLGAIIQLVTPYAVRRLGSHRRWSMIAVGCQATSLLLIPLAALLDGWALPMLFLAATVYWTSGLSCGPAWNTWMEDVIPATSRTHFFARRVRICQFCTMLGFVIGGLLLETGKRGDWLIPAFAALFSLASLSRFVSTYLLSRTTEPANARIVARTHVGLKEICSRLLPNWTMGKSAAYEQGKPVAGMQMLWFLFAMQASVQLSGPYFTPFMLRKMELRYDEFMLLVVLGFLGKVVALPAWGRLANRAGPRILLWAGGMGMVPLSGAWIALEWLEQPRLFLCCLQFAGGIAWAAYELGFFLMFFEAIPRRERTSVLTIFNFGNSASLLVGAVIGACWLSWHHESHHAYLALFVFSSVARLFSLLLLRRLPNSPRVVTA